MFIVLDSIDGAGKGLQRIEVSNYIRTSLNKEVHGEEFPVHNAFYETVIHPALQQQTKLNKASWVISYLLDKTLEADRINPYVGNPDNLFIADGYFTTTLAYQCFLMEQVSLEKLLEYSSDFEIPKPDLAIFIDADPEVAMKRKEKEEGHDEGLDIFEKDLAKQNKLRNIYENMYKNNVYCKWDKVDGNGTIQEVTNNILQILKNHKII